MTVPDLAEMQLIVNEEAMKRWPATCTVITEGLALAEEAGEVCRAILKRVETTRGTAEEWTVELRKELGQLFCVALNIAELEGWSADDVILEAVRAFQAKPMTEALNR